MSTMDLSASEIQNTSKKMMDHHAAIDAAMTRLFGQLENLHGAWIGQAEGAFRQAQANWNQLSKKHNVVLSGIADGLTGTAKSANELEHVNSSGLTKLATNLHV